MRKHARSTRFALSLTLLFLSAGECQAADSFSAGTRVKIVQNAWQLNGKPSYSGTRAEGLLLNARMVNAVFEDRNPATCPKGFDPDKNAEAFIARIPDYVGQGVRAFTISLQGGDPGYRDGLTSAFEASGSLREDYLKRVARVIEACDRAGAVVILSCFQPDQDQVLKDDGAVQRAVRETAGWIRDRGYGNVVLEIASDFIHKGYDRKSIGDASGMAGLIRTAKEAMPDLLVSASGGGGGRLDHQVATAGDFLLLHFDNVPVDEILERVATADKVSKPIVCNQDKRTGGEGAQALQAAVNALCSWGYFNPKNQRYPFQFAGAADDPVVYAKFKELTTPGK
jgi:hypothetical protein